jgi:hypothetical protein
MSVDLCPACGAYWACDCPVRADETLSVATPIDPDEWYHLQRELVLQAERLRRLPVLWPRVVGVGASASFCG